MATYAAMKPTKPSLEGPREQIHKLGLWCKGRAPEADPQVTFQTFSDSSNLQSFHYVELDDIMLEMESSDNLCSSVNNDCDDDVTEVYDDDDDDKADEEDIDHNRVGDSDNQDDDGLEHEKEVDSEVDNDDYRDSDDFWIPGFFKEECITTDNIVDISHVRDKQVLKWLKKLMLGDFEVIEFEEKWKEMVATFQLEDNNWIVELYEKRMKWSPAHLRGNFFSYVSRTIKLRVVDCKEMMMFSVYTVVKYCSGSVWRVSYCPSTVHFSCCCMRMQSIGLPCDHILAILVCLNFMELPSSLVLNRWSKSATKDIKEKYPDSSMYWDSHLMGKYDKMLHFLSNELRRLKAKKKRQDGIDESGKRRRIQSCGQCGGTDHNKRSCTNHPRNANVPVSGSFISSSEQTNIMCQPIDEYNYELFMQHPHTFVACSSCVGR
ncbi:hypothetical protein JHK87_047898 [Glycine soja]|nr:hypothetical protein JHK87_047898 [Glycine soja]